MVNDLDFSAGDQRIRDPLACPYRACSDDAIDPAIEGCPKDVVCHLQVDLLVGVLVDAEIQERTPRQVNDGVDVFEIVVVAAAVGSMRSTTSTPSTGLPSRSVCLTSSKTRSYHSLNVGSI